MERTLNAPHQQPQAAGAAAPAAPRLDLYAPIHKALRSFMSDTLCRVGRMDAADADELQPTLAQCDELLALCESHVHHENDFMHPAIEARQPSGSMRIAHEHEVHLQSIAELRDEVAALRNAATDARPPWRCAFTGTWRCSWPQTSSTCTSRRRRTTPRCGRTTATSS